MQLNTFRQSHQRSLCDHYFRICSSFIVSETQKHVVEAYKNVMILSKHPFVAFSSSNPFIRAIKELSWLILAEFSILPAETQKHATVT